MSLIHTCELSVTNPFEYLIALREHSGDVKANPGQWMPWNYKQTAIEIKA